MEASKSWNEMVFGSYSVTSLQHSIIILKDETHIAIKLWLPCLKKNVPDIFPLFATDDYMKWSEDVYVSSHGGFLSEKRFPTVIEYLPYGKDSYMTLSRDHAHHPWLSSYGYVIIRVDLRGTGASSGFYFDEYDQQEIDDCIEIIEWIALQSWSTGRVGMYGKSWGGFNGLQVAYKEPEALKAVISLYSTDNRFTDDVHYQGGSMVGNGMLSWANFMFSMNSRPPPPQYFKNLDSWKSAYINRLDIASQSFLVTWLHHQQVDDPFWKHGSIKTDYTKIKCPVFLIGGQADLYKNSAFRLAEYLNDSSRVIIGPWSHQWPDQSIIGPKIDYLNLCLQWWDFHLKEIKNRDTSVWPRFQLYILDSVKPQNIVSDNPGTWTVVPDLKIKNGYGGDDIEFFLYDDFTIQYKPSKTNAKPFPLNSNVFQGANAGDAFSVDNGFPGDQSLANEHSCCWITEPLAQDLVIIGFPIIKISYCVQESSGYFLHVRVCDQFPSGESSLITKGCKNFITERQGWVQKPNSKQKCTDEIILNGIGRVVRAGHCLLVSITPSYFPSIYPAIDSKGLVIYPSECSILFHTLTQKEFSNKVSFSHPFPLLCFPTVTITNGSYSTETQRVGDRHIITVETQSGLIKFPTLSYTYKEHFVEKYVTDEIVSFGDISAESVTLSSFDLNDGTCMDIEVKTSQTLSGAKQYFKVFESLNVEIEKKKFFQKSWENVVPRKYV